MQSLVLLATVAVAYFVYWCISGLRHNIAQAKKSDLPYIIARTSRDLPSTKDLQANQIALSLFTHFPTMANNAQAMDSSNKVAS